MLYLRIITAIVLLAVVLPVMFLGSTISVNVLCAVFFVVACWESLRLFAHRLAIPVAIIWGAIYSWLVFTSSAQQIVVVALIGSLAWSTQFIPALKTGLPERDSVKNRLLSALYGISIMACFLVMTQFQRHSPVYLLSVMALVWVADIGAYFCGKALGKRKLAPTISPGKSWEGAIGGCLCVLLVGSGSTMIPALGDTFSLTVLQRWGWGGLVIALTVLSAVSVVGDLFESLLKRRASMKDSSHLLPGHGGVLDRVDALIPVLPLAFLLDIVSKL